MTVRYLGCFLADPLEVPNEVLDVVAGQLGIEDPSCVKRYTERDKTRLEHTWEIAEAFGLKDFASAEVELAGKVRADAWNTGDGPTACFQYAVRWLRQNDVLLPGISTLTRPGTPTAPASRHSVDQWVRRRGQGQHLFVSVAQRGQGFHRGGPVGHLVGHVSLQFLGPARADRACAALTAR
ncbi:DUF4158 domain-containing protein [Nonomuraea sp. NPDC048826]|uniref:DUF4158 domain-containing protein n=1 Tax=Nonomuraea sp. NPDC048826 TaxID=3364347 RepID=UPI00370FDE20